MTVKTDSADDCVYGSNLTGELTSVDSDSEAQPCKHYMRANGNGDAQMDKKFKATAKVAPGKYSGVHLKIKDIWCSGIGIRNGSGSIQFNN